MSRPPEQVKQGTFECSSEREEQVERCRDSESKATERLLKKELAAQRPPRIIRLDWNHGRHSYVLRLRQKLRCHQNQACTILRRGADITSWCYCQRVRVTG